MVHQVQHIYSELTLLVWPECFSCAYIFLQSKLIRNMIKHIARFWNTNCSVTTTRCKLTSFANGSLHLLLFWSYHLVYSSFFLLKRIELFNLHRIIRCFILLKLFFFECISKINIPMFLNLSSKSCFFCTKNIFWRYFKTKNFF